MRTTPGGSGSRCSGRSRSASSMNYTHIGSAVRPPSSFAERTLLVEADPGRGDDVRVEADEPGIAAVVGRAGLAGEIAAARATWRPAPCRAGSRRSSSSVMTNALAGEIACGAAGSSRRSPSQHDRRLGRTRIHSLPSTSATRSTKYGVTRKPPFANTAKPRAISSGVDLAGAERQRQVRRQRVAGRSRTRRCGAAPDRCRSRAAGGSTPGCASAPAPRAAGSARRTAC